MLCILRIRNLTVVNLASILSLIPHSNSRSKQKHFAVLFFMLLIYFFVSKPHLSRGITHQTESFLIVKSVVLSIMGRLLKSLTSLCKTVNVVIL